MDIHTTNRNHSIFNEVDEDMRKVRDKSIEALWRNPQDDFLFKGMDGRDYFYPEDRKIADEEYRRRMYVPIGEHYIR